MGAFGEAFAAYAQPLIDQTDGSEDQLNKALSISQFCYNMALLPKESWGKLLSELKQSLEMGEEEFEDFQASIIAPMIYRHKEMFPQQHRRRSTDFQQSVPPPSTPSYRTPPEKVELPATQPKMDRYAPCPCNSGKKYKFCCGKKQY